MCPAHKVSVLMLVISPDSPPPLEPLSDDDDNAAVVEEVDTDSESLGSAFADIRLG